MWKRKGLEGRFSTVLSLCQCTRETSVNDLLLSIITDYLTVIKPELCVCVCVAGPDDHVLDWMYKINVEK